MVVARTARAGLYRPDDGFRRASHRLAYDGPQAPKLRARSRQLGNRKIADATDVGTPFLVTDGLGCTLVEL